MSSSSFQVFNIIGNSDLLIAFIYLILISFSLWSWSIIFDKFFKFRLLRLKTDKFDKLFWSGIMLEDIHEQVKTNVNYPSAMIFSAAMQEWENSNVLDIVQKKDIPKKESLRERLTMTMEVAFTKSMQKIKYGMTFGF
jgi:biopolymer transport protein TolQ